MLTTDYCSFARPHQPTAVFVSNFWMRKTEFFLEVFEVFLIQIKLARKRSIGESLSRPD